MSALRRSFGDMLEELSDRGMFEIEQAVRGAQRSAQIIPLRSNVCTQRPVRADERVPTPIPLDDFPGNRFTISLSDEDNRSWFVLGSNPVSVFMHARLWPRRRKVSGEQEVSYLRAYRAIPLGKSHFDLLWKDYIEHGDASALERFYREMGLDQLDFYGSRYQKGFFWERKYILSMVRKRTWSWRRLRVIHVWVRVCTPLRKKRSQAPLVV